MSCQRVRLRLRCGHSNWAFVVALAVTASALERGPQPKSELLTHSPFVGCVPAPRASANTHIERHVRVVTWNIHAARSAPVEDIAAELRQMNADVAALQELDVGTRRTGFIEEPKALAVALN